jgi:hypothetical protein
MTRGPFENEGFPVMAKKKPEWDSKAFFKRYGEVLSALGGAKPAQSRQRSKPG